MKEKIDTEDSDISSLNNSASKNGRQARRTSTHMESPVRFANLQQVKPPTKPAKSAAWTKKMTIAKILDAKQKESSESDIRGDRNAQNASLQNNEEYDDALPANFSSGSLARRRTTKTIDKTFQERFKKSSQYNSVTVLVMVGVELFYLSTFLITPWFQNKANTIAATALIVSFLVSIAFIQIARFLEWKFKTALVSFYIYVAGFLAIIVFTPSSISPIVLLLGFSMLSVNCLQSSMIRLTYHIISIFVLVIATYIIKSATLQTDCFIPGYCPSFNALDIGPQLFWAAMCLVGLLIVLHIDREVHVNYQDYKNAEEGVNDLVSVNLDLQNQLRVAQIKPETDIAAPLTRATQLLVSFQDKNRNTENDAVLKEIENVLSILNSDKLFEPEFFQDTGDTDVTNFLQDVLQTKRTTQFKTLAGPAKTVHKSNTKKIAQSNLMNLLDTVSEPFFSIIDLEVLSEGHALYYTAVTIFKEHDFQQVLGISERVFCQWILKMELGYDRKNPYHNSSHAADVLQVINFFITRPKLNEILTVEETLSCILAAIGHDYMHPGVTNAFLIATRNPLALRYNDTSVLEHFHAASVAELFGQSEFDLFSRVTPESKKYMREMIITMIMATDMSFHFEWLSKFKNKLSTNSFNFENLNDKKLVLNIAMKCADINNLTRPLEISRMWTQLVIEEFFNQGDQEKARGLPVSMFMDRNNTDIPKCQIGFIDYIVLPLYEAWGNFLTNELDAHIANLKSNKAFWKGKSEEGKPIEKVHIPKFNVSVLRIRGSHRMSSKGSNAVAKKRSSVSVGSTTTSPAVASERPSIISRLIRRFSVSSRISSNVEEGDEDKASGDSKEKKSQKEELENISDTESGEIRKSTSIDNMSIASRDIMMVVETSTGSSADSPLEEKIADPLAEIAQAINQPEEEGNELADFAGTFRNHESANEIEPDKGEELPDIPKIAHISKRRKSLSVPELSSVPKLLPQPSTEKELATFGGSTKSSLMIGSSDQPSNSVPGKDGYFDGFSNIAFTNTPTRSMAISQASDYADSLSMNKDSDNDNV